MTSNEVEKLRAALMYPVLLPVFYRNKSNPLSLRTEAAKALNSMLTFFIISIPIFGIVFGLTILFNNSGSFLFMITLLLFIYWIVTITNMCVNSRNLKKNQPTSYLPSFDLCKVKA